jgi:hypothetical protein
MGTAVVHYRSRWQGSGRPNLPLALPHLPSELLQLLGLPVGVLDLVDLLEPIPAASKQTKKSPMRISQPARKQPGIV